MGYVCDHTWCYISFGTSNDLRCRCCNFFPFKYPMWYTHQLTFIHWYDCLCCQLMNTYGYWVAEGLHMSLSGPMLSNYVFPCVPYSAMLSVDKDTLKAGFCLDVPFITPPKHIGAWTTCSYVDVLHLYSMKYVHVDIVLCFAWTWL